VLSGYRFVYPVDVAFRDLDALAHVNNTVFLRYLESARIAYWLQVTRRQGLGALDMILARAEIDFRGPLFFGQSIDVGVRTESLRRSSFTMGFRIVEQKTGRLVADARKVLVYYDFAAQEKRDIPESIRALLRAQDPEVVEEL